MYMGTYEGGAGWVVCSMMNPSGTISEKMSMEEQLKQHGGAGQFTDVFSHNPVEAFQV